MTARYAMELFRERVGTAWLPDAQSVQNRADRGEVSDLSLLWKRLASGEYGIVNCFSTSERCYVCLQSREPTAEARRFLTDRNVEVLRRILLGDAQKAIAFELDLAASTVSLIASRCLHALGIDCCIAKVPVLMVLAAHAEGGGVSSFDAKQSEVGSLPRPVLLLSFRRPDTQLSKVLSSSRCSVARMRVEGLTHREIARIRGTSPRTVANQLSATFRQLCVSGRIEMLRRLIRDEVRPAKVLGRRSKGAKASSLPVNDVKSAPCLCVGNAQSSCSL